MTTFRFRSGVAEDKGLVAGVVVAAEQPDVAGAAGPAEAHLAGDPHRGYGSCPRRDLNRSPIFSARPRNRGGSQAAPARPSPDRMVAVTAREPSSPASPIWVAALVSASMAVRSSRSPSATSSP